MSEKMVDAIALGIERRCRYCKHMVDGSEGSMHCEFSMCEDDSTAESCNRFGFFIASADERSKQEKCEICGQPIEKKEFFACTGWATEDVMAEANDLGMEITREQALNLLEEHSEEIVEAMVDSGFAVIRDVLRHEKEVYSGRSI